MDQIVLTRKIELFVNEVGDKKNECYDLLHYLNNNLYKIANDSVNYLHIKKNLPEFILKHNKNDYEKYITNLNKMSEIKNFKSDEFIKLKNENRDIINKYSNNDHYKKIIYNDSKESTLVYHNINKRLPNGLSIIGSSLAKKIENDYKIKEKDYFLGKSTLNIYKKGLPIPFNLNSKLVKEPSLFFKFDNDKYYINLFGYNFGLFFGADRSNNKAIIEYIINDTDKYKLCDSAIQLKDKKILLLLSFKQPVDKTVKLDENKVLGVDLGVSTPVYLAINNDEYYKKQIGDIHHFDSHKIRYKKRYSSLIRNLEISNGGKGRNKKLSALNKLKKVEKNWTDTEQHKISSSVIKEALNNNCKYINLENLENYKENLTENKKYIMRIWGYYGIQEKIIYKAKKHNIIVKKINPAYTSQKCHKCGNVEKSARNKQIFTCLNDKCSIFGKEIHADFNGAKNISLSKEFK